MTRKLFALVLLLISVSSTPRGQSVNADRIVSPGDLALDPRGKDVLPLRTYDINLGSLQRKFLTLHAAELWVETLVAQNTIATIGGRVLVAPTNVLVGDLADDATTITVKYNNFVSGDRLYMEGDGRVEFFAVTSTASGPAGAYVYSVTRNLDGTGANEWFAGAAIVNTGQAGNGFIDLYSLRGIRAGTEVGPSIVGNVRNSATYNDWSPRWAVGNLNGLYSFGTNTYGAAFGDPNGTWIVIEPTYGIRMGYGGNGASPAKVTIDPSGNASFAGTITSEAGSIAGWTIIPGYLYSGATSTARVGIKSSDTPGSVAFYAGDFNESAAPFRVTHDGQLFASNANITGSINATSGNFTGSITGATITGGSISGTSISGVTFTGNTFSGVTISGSTINAGSGNEVVLNSTGITIDASISAAGRVKWSDGSYIGSWGTGQLEVRAPTSIRIEEGTGSAAATGIRIEGGQFHPYSGSGSPDLGTSSNKWGSFHFDGTFDWDGYDSQNAAIGEPLVISSDGVVHRSTNGFSGNCSGTVTVENGIVTGCS